MGLGLEDVRWVDDGLGVVLGLGVEVGLGGDVVVRIVVGSGGREVEGTGGRVVLGRGGKEGLGGLDPPFVGVFTSLPSQYIVRPVSVSSFKTVLIPFVPGPLQYTEFLCPVFSGFGYSMWKTGFPNARNWSYALHSLSCAHCSFTAKSMIGATVFTMSKLFFKPIFILYFKASFCIHCM